MTTKKIMKPAAFKKALEEITEVGNAVAVLDRAGDDRNWALYTAKKAELKRIKAELEENCEIVNVSYTIGSRGYNERAFKVGKFYFTLSGYTKLTSYYNPTEIPEITQEMKDEALEDSYYY